MVPFKLPQRSSFALVRSSGRLHAGAPLALQSAQVNFLG